VSKIIEKVPKVLTKEQRQEQIEIEKARRAEEKKQISSFEDDMNFMETLKTRKEEG
jgi:hypothetical protein